MKCEMVNSNSKVLLARNLEIHLLKEITVTFVSQQKKFNFSSGFCLVQKWRRLCEAESFTGLMWYERRAHTDVVQNTVSETQPTSAADMGQPQLLLSVWIGYPLSRWSLPSPLSGHDHLPQLFLT